MIENESAYLRKLEQIKENNKFIESEKVRFKNMQMSDDEITTAIEPLITFCKQLEEEVVQITEDNWKVIESAAGAFTNERKFLDGLERVESERKADSED